MSHSKELIERIASKLDRDYPRSAFEYVFEKALPGTRMFPDVTVIQPGVGVRCVVEIGYTRPEKLTAYRVKHKIPDVRWYDKAGVLHTSEPERPVVIERVSLEPSHEFAVYRIDCSADCLTCFENACPLENGEPDDNGHVWELSDEEKARWFDDAYELACAQVYSWVVTDYDRAQVFSYCDECNKWWLPVYPDEETLLGELEDLSASEFGRKYGGRTLLTWAAVQRLIRGDGCSLPMMYGEWHRLERQR